MKNKADKKVNQRIKRINKQLKEDVFGTRFWLKQVKKSKVDDVSYYLYELRDRIEPDRNKIISHWMSEFEILTFHNLDIEINNFIVESDFWKQYKN